MSCNWRKREGDRASDSSRDAEAGTLTDKRLHSVGDWRKCQLMMRSQSRKYAKSLCRSCTGRRSHSLMMKSIALLLKQMIRMRMRRYPMYRNYWQNFCQLFTKKAPFFVDIFCHFFNYFLNFVILKMWRWKCWREKWRGCQRGCLRGWWSTDSCHAGGKNRFG